MFFLTRACAVFLVGAWGVAPVSAIRQVSDRFKDRYFEVVTTSQGLTHFQDVGPKDGPVVVLTHGVSGPLPVWDYTVPALVKRGYRVLRWDLMGRGFSDRPPAFRHGPDSYVYQLEELLVARGIGGPLTLVGSSFGAVVSASFALRHPGRMRRLILIGPAGFPIKVPLLAKLRDLPVVGDLLFKVFGRGVILDQNRKYFVDGEPPEDFWNYFQAQLDIAGTQEAMRATLAHPSVQGSEALYRKLQPLAFPVGVIWGRQDVTFPFEQHKTLQKLVPKATVIPIDNAGHIPQFERPVPTNAALASLMNE